MVVLSFALVFALVENARADNNFGRIIATYSNHNTTHVVIETQENLISGRLVYVGPGSTPVTVGQLLSTSKGFFYYDASIAGKHKFENGENISLESVKLSTVSILSVTINERYNFQQKRFGEVTAVQGDHAMIDKGSLHEVRERDLYRIYDSSGFYKGLIELRGIGDLQSSGKLYNAIEDLHRDVLSVKPGDRVVFAGQRKLFGLGLMGAVRDHRDHLLDGTEQNYGAGLLWNLTFPDGWGIEVYFGYYDRDGAGKLANVCLTGPCGPGPFYQDTLTRTARYIAPVWLKKNFFYPSVVSPFVGAGLYLFNGRNSFTRIYNFPSTLTNIDETKSVTKIEPVIGTGLEFFPGRFFRPRIEIRYFAGPNIEAGGNTFYTDSVFYSFGFLTAW